MYNISFIIVSLLFLSFAMILNHYIIKTVDSMSDKIEKPMKVDIEHLRRIPKYILGTNIVVFLFGFCTLIREIKEKLL
jgi:hypothetical protein